MYLVLSSRILIYWPIKLPDATLNQVLGDFEQFLFEVSKQCWNPDLPAYQREIISTISIPEVDQTEIIQSPSKAYCFAPKMPLWSAAPEVFRSSLGSLPPGAKESTGRKKARCPFRRCCGEAER